MKRICKYFFVLINILVLNMNFALANTQQGFGEDVIGDDTTANKPIPTTNPSVNPSNLNLP